eukprot:3374343-Prymnesium_polylepis.2
MPPRAVAPPTARRRGAARHCSTARRRRQERAARLRRAAYPRPRRPALSSPPTPAARGAERAPFDPAHNGRPAAARSLVGGRSFSHVFENANLISWSTWPNLLTSQK